MNKLIALIVPGLIFNIAAAATETKCLELEPSVQCVDLKTNQVVKAAELDSKEQASAPAAQKVLFDRTGGAAVETTSAENSASSTTTTTTVTKTVRRLEKETLPPTPADYIVTGRSVVTKSGAVVVVPAAQENMISAVTASGEIIRIPRSDVQTQNVSALQKNSKTEWAVTGHKLVNQNGQQVVIVPVAKPGYASGVTSTGEIVTFQMTTPLQAQKIQVTPAPVAATTTTTTTSFAANNMQTAVAAPAATTTVTQEITTAEKSDLAVEKELTSAQNSVVTQAPATEETGPSRVYAMAVLSTNAYPQVSNVNPGYAVSGAVGTFLGNYMVEGGLSLAKYSLDVRNYTYFNQRDNFDVNQYQAHVAGKYQFTNLLPGNFKPLAGVIATYTYRQYSLTKGYLNTSGDTGNSNAVDAGVIAGLDYEFDAKYAVGIDFKYMFNLSHQVNAAYNNPTYGYSGTPIESLQYYTAGLSARMNF